MKAIVNTPYGLNLRSGPDTSYPVLVILPYKTEVIVLDKGTAWDKVQYRSWTGFVYNKFLDYLSSTEGIGIDLSGWNEINFSEFTMPKLLIHRATYGTQYDRSFLNRFGVLRAKSRGAGTKLGFYHFLTEEDPYQQFEAFMELVNPKDNEIVAIDVEQYDQEWTPNKAYYILRLLLELFLDEGIIPYIYTSAGQWTTVLSHFGQDNWFKQFPLWVANYGVQAPAIPKPWDDWKIWQYTDKGSWPGVKGRVDLNRYKKEVVDED